MRKGYWIIVVFAIWCVVSALWYMFSVKGLPDNTGLIKPSTTTIAIIEIVVMITVAFLLGFGLAWLMRTEPLEILTDELQNSKYEIREFERTITVQKETASNALSTSHELNSQLLELTASEEKLKQKNRDLETKVQILDGEVNSFKFRVRVLEAEVADKNKAIGALSQELDTAGSTPKVEHRDWSDHPFVRPVPDPPAARQSASPNDRDDLTEIKGIGPAFQKKLNVLDIYTFKQISELDGESVERLAELIEVFPDRIHRDNWIGQATRLYQKQLGKEV